MKIYIDELPKSCDDCEFGYFYDCQYCTLRPDLMRKDEWCEKEKHCPLEATQSLKQQVKKEVYDEIINKIEQAKLIYEWKGKETTIEDILSKIEKGDI